MRLKTFHAETLAGALELVRQTLGSHAIIVATHEDDASRGARVTAAVDQDEQKFDFFSDGASEETLEYLTSALEQHGVPNPLIDRLIDAATDGTDNTPTEVLAGALSRVFSFHPLPQRPGDTPIMLIGPPGVGKTVSCAKFAARAALSDDFDINLVSADPVRVTAIDQLRAYAQRLDATFYEAPDADALAALLTHIKRKEMVVIDTPGTNPYNMKDLAHLVELAEAGKPLTVLVLTAGRDAQEAADLAEAFRPVGPTSLMTTGLDMAKKLGSVLSAADAAGLSLTDVSMAPEIGAGLTPLDPSLLARLLLPNDAKENADVRDTGVRTS
jgi:flagellar biosynthesis protein FlhF